MYTRLPMLLLGAACLQPLPPFAGKLLAADGIRKAAPISFTIAGLRVTPQRWDKEANFSKLVTYARQAGGKGAKLIITPEGFLEGYVGNDKANPDVTEERYRAIGEGID